MLKLNDADHPVVLFDGVCNLCSSSVQFIIKHDPKRKFRFASLQSPFGQAVLKKYGLPANDLNSFILLEANKIYARSAGALRVAKRLNGLWPLMYALMIVPKFIRDAIYDYIAHHRYKWFGKKEECWIPAAEFEVLFLDASPMLHHEYNEGEVEKNSTI